MEIEMLTEENVVRLDGKIRKYPETFFLIALRGEHSLRSSLLSAVCIYFVSA